MKTLNSTNVHEVEDGEEVAVWCPAKLEWVPCKLEAVNIGYMDGVYLTTLDSKYEEYNSNCSAEKNYGDYIQHLRGTDSHAAVMTRETVAKLLDSREYSLR